MNQESQQFGAYLREHADERLAELVDRAQAIGPSYAAVSREELRESLHNALAGIAALIEKGDDQPLRSYVRSIIRQRLQEAIEIDELVSLSSLVRQHVWERLEQYSAGRPAWSLSATQPVVNALLHNSDLILNSFAEALENLRVSQVAQAEQLESQRTVIRQIGTPILPIYEGVIVLPLVGAIDSHRATQVMEALLEAISTQQAEIVILDITGVPMVDTSIANYLLQTARAAQLVGAQVVLVGIGAEIAQTIVQLGVDLSGLQVYANLQAGISFALGRMGRTIS